MKYFFFNPLIFAGEVYDGYSELYVYFPNNKSKVRIVFYTLFGLSFDPSKPIDAFGLVYFYPNLSN